MNKTRRKKEKSNWREQFQTKSNLIKPQHKSPKEHSVLHNSHYVHFPCIPVQNIVELLPQLNKIGISARQFQERPTCVGDGPTSSALESGECNFNLVGNQGI